MIPSLFLQFPRIEPEKAGPGAGISALGVGGDSVAGVLYLGSAYTVCSGLVGYSALPVEAFFFSFSHCLDYVGGLHADAYYLQYSGHGYCTKLWHAFLAFTHRYHAEFPNSFLYMNSHGVELF
jgi:hypothetical protein